MNPCQNCGKINAGDASFCRFCGTRLAARQPVPGNPYDHSAPPRPYAWKTDEFRTQNEVRPTAQIDQKGVTDRVPPPAPRSYTPATLMHQQNQFTVPFRCPRCGTTHMPVYERRISTAGWIVFGLLLVFTVIFFWIGLLMKENVAVCPVCRLRLS